MANGNWIVTGGSGAIGSAVVALVGAIVVVIWLPRHSAVPAPVPVEAAEDGRELAEVA